MILLDVAAPLRSPSSILRERVTFSAEGVEGIGAGADWASVRAIPMIFAVLRGEVGDVE